MAGNHRRVGRETAQEVSHGGAVVVEDIDHGSQIDVHTRLAHLTGQPCGIVSGGVLVIDSAQIFGRHRGQETVLRFEARHLATLLVGGDEFPIGEPYSKWRAIDAMKAGKVAICSCGTGSPFFTTDTGSTLRAIEVEADVMLKGTRVDGIYTADPEKDPTATKFDRITYDEIYNRGLKVMDMTATVMARDNNLPIHVFNMDVYGNLHKVMAGEPIGTVVTL